MSTWGLSLSDLVWGTNSLSKGFQILATPVDFDGNNLAQPEYHLVMFWLAATLNLLFEGISTLSASESCRMEVCRAVEMTTVKWWFFLGMGQILCRWVVR